MSLKKQSNLLFKDCVRFKKVTLVAWPEVLEMYSKNEKSFFL